MQQNSVGFHFLREGRVYPAFTSFVDSSSMATSTSTDLTSSFVSSSATTFSTVTAISVSSNSTLFTSPTTSGSDDSSFSD